MKIWLAPPPGRAFVVIVFVVALASCCGQICATAQSSASPSSSTMTLAQLAGLNASSLADLILLPPLRVAAYVSLTGSLATTGLQIRDGIQFWAEYINWQGGFALNATHRLQVNLTFWDDKSTIAGATVAWNDMMAQNYTTVIGGHTSMTDAASAYFEPLSVINIQCCTGPDVYYTTTPRKWLFGIHRSSQDYPKSFLRAMQNRGVTNAYVIYSDLSIFFTSTADSAETFCNDVGVKLLNKTSFPAAGYNSTNAGGQKLYRALVDAAALANKGVRFALLIVAGDVDGRDATKWVMDLGMDIDALWVTVAPTNPGYLQATGVPAAEWVFSPLQWHYTQNFQDPIFGSNSHFVSLWKTRYGTAPSYTSGSGTAAAVALQLAIQSGRSLRNTDVAQSMRELTTDSFFGPLAFNRYQRNYGGTTATMQMLDGTDVAILPDASASRLMEMLPKRAARAACPGTSSVAMPCIRLLGTATANNGGLTGGVIAAIVVPCCAAFAGVLIAIVLLRKDGRDNSAAPKDGEKPFAMVFTDIQSSTNLWARVPSAMGPAVEHHHQLIRVLVQEYRGYEVKTIGDSFMVAFVDPVDALHFCVALQSRFAEYAWDSRIETTYKDLEADSEWADKRGGPWNGLRVRCGMHYGLGTIKLDPVSKGYDYYGTVVNTAARVEGVGHGGQVLLTDDAYQAVLKQAAKTDFCTFEDLGPQPLRGLEEPVRLFQSHPVGYEGRKFPPLRLDVEVEVEGMEDEEADLAGGGGGFSRISVSGSRKGDSRTTEYEDVEGLMMQAVRRAVKQSETKVSTEDMTNACIMSFCFLRALFSTTEKKVRNEQLARLAKKWRAPAAAVDPGSDQSMLRLIGRVAPVALEAAITTFPEWRQNMTSKFATETSGTAQPAGDLFLPSTRTASL